MWGGLTTPAELRAIADVADKFDIPTVKVTGGQRIDLLGVKKEDLPAVWADLNKAGMVSGHAYAKGLRTVKTCVGTDWCRFGTQDSTGLGVKLEKFLWGSWTPAKVKLAVSGCPRNCAEATCKDIGVVCVDSGYEILFGGAAGLHIQGTEALVKADSEDEALEIIGALMQLYREQARYLERIYKWIDRVGASIRQGAGGRRPRQAPRALRPLRLFAALCADRPLGRARRGRATRTSSRRSPNSHGADVNMSDWTDIGAVGGRSRVRGARVCRHGGAARRGVPHRRRRVFALDDRCPHKGGPLQPGHRPRRQRHLPAAQLGHRPGDGEAPGRRRRQRAQPSRCGSRTGACCSMLAAGRRRGMGETVRTTCPYCGVGCGVIATPGPEGGRHRRRSRPPRQFRPAVLQGRGARARPCRWRRGCCIR